MALEYGTVICVREKFTQWRETPLDRPVWQALGNDDTTAVPGVAKCGFVGDLSDPLNEFAPPWIRVHSAHPPKYIPSIELAMQVAKGSWKSVR